MEAIKSSQRTSAAAYFLAIIAIAAALFFIISKSEAQPSVQPASQAVTKIESHKAPTNLTTSPVANHPGSTLYHVEYGTWRYNAFTGKDDSGKAGVSVTSSYYEQSKQSLDAYAAANHDLLSKQLADYVAANQLLAKQLAAEGGNARATITFRSYLSPEQYRNFVKTHNLTPADVTVVDVQADGTPGIGMIPANGVPKEAVPTDEYLKDYLLRAGGIKADGRYYGPTMLRGMVGANVQVAASELPALEADPLVYLADVTVTQARRDLAALGVAGTDEDTSQNQGRSRDSVQDVYWVIKALKMDNFK